MIKIGDKFIVKKHGKRCTSVCDAPCIGEWIVIIKILPDDRKVVVEFPCDGEQCSKFNIEDFEEFKKTIKQYGIVNFINSTTKREEQNV